MWTPRLLAMHENPSHVNSLYLNYNSHELSEEEQLILPAVK